MKYDFDQINNRGVFPNSKWEDMSSEYYGYDVANAIPMWVADMEFKTLPQVSQALMERAENGIFGYNANRGLQEFKAAVQDWTAKRYRWKIEEHWILYCPGIVTAINIAVQAYTKPQDCVLILSPVYPPFSSAVTKNGRKLVAVPLVEANNCYTIDFDQFEREIVGKSVKLFIHCSPHNPVGRVWTMEESRQICEICHRHQVRIFSDDIHADLVFEPHRYFPAALAGAKYENLLTVAYSCGKTFNLAGLETASIIIPDKESREAFSAVYATLGLSTKPSSFGGLATVTAYRWGESYVDELVAYLNGNIELACTWIQAKMPKLRVSKPEGTYLLWLDYRNTQMSDEEFQQFLFEGCKIVANPGHWFGPNGSGFMRLNVAFPKKMIETALGRLQAAYDNRWEAQKGQ